MSPELNLKSVSPELNRVPRIKSTAVLGNPEAPTQVISRWVRDFTGGITNIGPATENDHGSHDTATSGSTEVNEKNREEFKKASEEIKNIITEVAKTAGQAGKEAAVNSAIEALEKAGYTLAATTLRAAMRFDLAGAFDAISLGDPTDVAGLLKRQGEKFINENLYEISQRKFKNDLSLAPDAELKLRISVNQAIENYLTNINYAYNFTNLNGNIKATLVFPDIKFDFKSFMRSDYWVEGVQPNQ